MALDRLAVPGKHNMACRVWINGKYINLNEEKGMEEIKNMDYLLGVRPDAPVVENEKGGKQSDTPYGFHMIPPTSIFKAAEVLKYGADKYGETFTNRNYTKISSIDHLNHALQHIYAHLAGDTSDDHLGHALVRLMFAYDMDIREHSDG